MRINFLIWASFPSSEPIKKRFKNAFSSRFLKSDLNHQLYIELKTFIVNFFQFIISSFYELTVNIKFGLPFKILKFKKKLREAEKTESHPNIFGIILYILKTKPKVSVNFNQAQSILKEGNPLVIVANHSYVPIDGFSIMSYIHTYRKDYAIVINSNKFIESLKKKYLNHFVSVVNTQTKLKKGNHSFAHKLNVRSLKKCIQASIIRQMLNYISCWRRFKIQKMGR